MVSAGKQRSCRGRQDGLQAFVDKDRALMESLVGKDFQFSPARLLLIN